MFDGISDERLLSMSGKERRWLDNLKKAFFESDCAYIAQHPETCCMEELCKAIDTAKTLRRSLRGDVSDTSSNKERFIEFLELDIPSPSENGLNVMLLDARTGKYVSYSFAGLVYAIRCMVHENENLNAAEEPEYHILIDWMKPASHSVMGKMEGGRLTSNGHLVWRRLREVVAKFITGIEAQLAFATGKGFSIRIDPPLGSIRPFESTQTGSI